MLFGWERNWIEKEFILISIRTHKYFTITFNIFRWVIYVQYIWADSSVYFLSVLLWLRQYQSSEAASQVLTHHLFTGWLQVKIMKAQKISFQVNTREICIYILPILWVFLQIILSSTVNINKNFEYDTLVPWLGDCLFLKKGTFLWVEDCKVPGFTSVLVFTLALYICVNIWIFNSDFYDLHTVFQVY
jgi:hypothetical protein